MNILLGMIGPAQLMIILVPAAIIAVVVYVLTRQNKDDSQTIITHIPQQPLNDNFVEEVKKCPYCDEEILAVAKKCKHCGEWLEK